MQIDTLAQSAAGLVAGGELGHILVSGDHGVHWQSARIPNERHALINQIVFATPRSGVAVGNDGWILRTDDGGQSWREAAFDPKGNGPLMSAANVGPGRWIAAGAFGLMMRSDDDGQHWQSFTVEGVGDHHLNRIVGAPDGRHWIIVGERGLVMLSDDAGANWRIVPPFYNGSLYGAVANPAGAGSWLAYGMRGNVFRSLDGGQSWTRAEVGAPVSLFGDARSASGELLLAGQGGMVLGSNDGGAHFSMLRHGTRLTLTDLAAVPNGWLAASDGGLRAYSPDFRQELAVRTDSAAQQIPGARP
ncbi:YCF48-related protein [Paraburkholderia sacchari]